MGALASGLLELYCNASFATRPQPDGLAELPMALRE
jgi:hypothetical protein